MPEGAPMLLGSSGDFAGPGQQTFLRRFLERTHARELTPFRQRRRSRRSRRNVSASKPVSGRVFLDANIIATERRRCRAVPPRPGVRGLHHASENAGLPDNPASGRDTALFGDRVSALDLISSGAVAFLKLRQDKTLDRDLHSVGRSRPFELVRRDHRLSSASIQPRSRRTIVSGTQGHRRRQPYCTT